MFGKKGKLSPRYLGPFQVLKKIGEVSYRLDLPPDFPNVLNVFHVSMLRRFLRDPLRDYLIKPPMEMRHDLMYRERPVEIVGQQEKIIRNKVMPLVKVWWTNQRGGEATWEKEKDMQKQYPELFSSSR